MRSSGRDWLAASAGVELHWDVLGIVKTLYVCWLLLEGMCCCGVEDLHRLWETLLGPSVA